MTTRIQVTYDCADPGAMAEFWATALGYRLQDPPRGFDTWEAFLADAGVPESEWGAVSAIVDPDGARPRIYLQRVPEAKAGKNRLHFDLGVTAGPQQPLTERIDLVTAEVQRLQTIGATKVETRDENGEFWVVMRDVEGNEFCVQ